MRLALLILLPSAAWAGHPLSTDDAGTVDPGSAEVELALGAGTGPALTTEHGLAVHLGASERFDLGVSWASATEGPLLVVGGPALDAKLRLLDGDGARPALAVRIDAALPTADAGPGVGGSALATVELGRWAALLDVGPTCSEGVCEAHASAAGALQATDALGLVGEVGWDGGSIWSIGGATLALGPDIALSAGAGPTWSAGSALTASASAAVTAVLP